MNGKVAKKIRRDMRRRVREVVRIRGKKWWAGPITSRIFVHSWMGPVTWLLNTLLRRGVRASVVLWAAEEWKALTMRIARRSLRVELVP